MATALNTIVFDLGSTAIKAAVCRDNELCVPVFSRPAPDILNDHGLYISDAMAYKTEVDQLLEKCLRYTNATPLLGVCFQRSSLLIWSRKTGLPATPLISWQDNRGIASCDALSEHNAVIRQIAGVPLAPYYFAPKMRVLLLQQPDLLQGIMAKELLMGTLDSFLIWHWTEGKYYITDASMAARTLLMDIKNVQWSGHLCELFNVPQHLLPEIKPSNDLGIELSSGAILQTSVADQSAAMLASVANDTSEVLVNLGTGGFVVRYLSQDSINETGDYLKTLVYQDRQKVKHWALEGTLNSISAALQAYPFQDCKTENLAQIENIYSIAEPTGVGAPYFRTDIGVMFSQQVEHLTAQQIATLLLEGIIFRIALILEQYHQHSTIQRVYLSGGLSALPCLQQGLASCSPAPVFRIIQRQAGLQGVLILTHSLQSASDRKAELITVDYQFDALVNKYQRWKGWFYQVISD